MPPIPARIAPPSIQGAYKQLKKDFIDTGKVKFIYREVYFDRYGLWASMVARCGGPEKFFGISDLIFEGQSEWTKAGGPAEIVDELRKIGRLAGIDNDQLEACLQDGTRAQTLVAWYQENAERDGIQATPSFIVNGKKVDNHVLCRFQEADRRRTGQLTACCDRLPGRSPFTATGRSAAASAGPCRPHPLSNEQAV